MLGTTGHPDPKMIRRLTVNIAVTGLVRDTAQERVTGPGLRARAQTWRDAQVIYAEDNPEPYGEVAHRDT